MGVVAVYFLMIGHIEIQEAYFELIERAPVPHPTELLSKTSHLLDSSSLAESTYLPRKVEHDQGVHGILNSGNACATSTSTNNI